MCNFAKSTHGAHRAGDYLRAEGRWPKLDRLLLDAVSRLLLK